MDRVPAAVLEMQNALGEKIVQAYLLAADVHKGQKRKTGEPYVTHPVEVARLLFDMGADQDVICAALLHDALEDNTDAEKIRNQIYTEFGDQVLFLVQAVSKDGEIADKIEQQSAYMQQIEQAFEVDIFVFFIKVADLLHNMSTISALSTKRKEQWIKELKYIYLPLFAEYYHRITLPHRDMYHHMITAIEKVIEDHDNTHSL